MHITDTVDFSCSLKGTNFELDSPSQAGLSTIILGMVTKGATDIGATSIGVTGIGVDNYLVIQFL